MDNLCHTLVGAAIGKAGLDRRTRYGMATLVIAANLPDVDVLVFATDVSPVAFRRGWTHGVLAQLVLPLVLSAGVVLWARLRPARTAGAPPAHAGWVLALAFVGVYSHVFLDLLNNYGVRLLAPFDWRWFYGDALFIVDPWLWALLGAGIWLSRRTGRAMPARGALSFACAYVLLMVLSARAARAEVADAWTLVRHTTPRRLMVGPMPVTPFRRQVIVDAGDHYETGSFSWWDQRVHFAPQPVPKGDDLPGVARARETPGVHAFLSWARFPFWTFTDTADGPRLGVDDLRYAGEGSPFSLRVGGR